MIKVGAKIDCGLKAILLGFIETVPPFGTAHTLCASRNGPRNMGFLRSVPSKQKPCLLG